LGAFGVEGFEKAPNVWANKMGLSSMQGWGRP